MSIGISFLPIVEYSLSLWQHVEFPRLRNCIISDLYRISTPNDDLTDVVRISSIQIASLRNLVLSSFVELRQSLLFGECAPDISMTSLTAWAFQTPAILYTALEHLLAG